jgi:hypothetical protein
MTSRNASPPDALRAAVSASGTCLSFKRFRFISATVQDQPAYTAFTAILVQWQPNVNHPLVLADIESKTHTISTHRIYWAQQLFVYGNL